MHKLVLLRHGQSQWNLENRFTGWTDVDLTPQGIVEAGNAGNLLKKEGYDAFIVRDSHFKSKLQNALNGRPLNLVMDSIGGKIFKTGYDLLASQGRVVVYGSARYGGTGDSPNWISLAYKYLFRPRIDPQKMIEQNKGILGFNLIWLYEQKELMKQDQCPLG